MFVSVKPENHHKPRIGVPWRTTNEENEQTWAKLNNYLNAVKEAGGEAVPISLKLSPEELAEVAETLDAVVLPGSPADVEPARYGAARHPKAADADANRESTDVALLNDAIAGRKPVLAICYGLQLLNVHLGGTLIQDIHSVVETELRHSKNDPPPGTSDPLHRVRLEPGSRVALLAGSTEPTVNSSHHQAIARPGSKLRVTAYSQDGIIEAVEWDGDAHWIVGVQWHPERMFAYQERGPVERPRDEFARRIFSELIAAAHGPLASRS
jgi:putative glutamine amidotransferase